MGKVSSIDQLEVRSASWHRLRLNSARWLPLCSALEVIVVFAGIITYIWRWQRTWHYVWIGLLGIMLLSQLLHKDTLQKLGLSFTQVRANAEIILPIALAFYVPLFVFGFARSALAVVPLNWHTAAALLGYGSWCAAQQYIAQSFFHNRLMEAVRSAHFSSFVVAFMFAATHLPNAILTVATFVAGYVFSEVFARHRSIWPLALAQAVGGLLVAAVSPPALIRNMRIGPSYFFFHIPRHFM